MSKKITDEDYVGKNITYYKNVNDHWSGTFTFPNGYAISFAMNDRGGRNYKSVIKEEILKRVWSKVAEKGWSIQPVAAEVNE